MTIGAALGLLLGFALFGYIVYLVTTYIPMPAPFAQVIVVACVVLLVLFLIRFLAGGAPLNWPLLR